MHMRSNGSKRGVDALPKLLVPTGIFLALAGAGIVPVDAFAACSAAGTTVTCAASATPYSYANGANNLGVTVEPGATITVPSVLGGAALSLTGSGVTLTNSGTIDPSLGAPFAMGDGAVVGNVTTASTVSVTNTSTGVMRGTAGVPNSAPALFVENGTGGTTRITNAGTIGSTGIVAGPGSLVVGTLGGAQVDFTNATGGMIAGSVSLAPDGTAGGGNTFTNAGTVTGTVSLGAAPGTANTFNALTGSSAGFVDGGFGGNNTLNLQQNPAAGSPANGTIAINTYGDFNHLNVQSGTWTIDGVSSATNASLTGGAAIVGNAGALGLGSITANGGALQAGSTGVNLGNAIALGAGGLTLNGANALGLGGTISGNGGLAQTGAGTTTLSGANTYTGGTTLSGGGLIAGTGSALGTGALNVTGAGGTLATSAPGTTLANAINLGAGSTLTVGGANNLGLGGAISGPGGLAVTGPGTTTLTAANTYTGGTTVNSGTLAIRANGSLAATSPVNLAGTSAVLDLSGAATSQSIGTLSGVAGSAVNLGANDLTLDGTGNGTYAGNISGTGGVTMSGTGTQALTGSNTYSGGTTMNGGSLIVDSGSALGTGALNVAGPGGTLATNVPGATLANAINLGSGSTLGLNGANPLSLRGAIAGNGGLAQTGAGTTTLSGANTYTGGTTLSNGGLVAGSGTALGTGALNVTGPGGTLATNASGTALPNAVNLGAGSTLTVGGANNLGLNGPIAGAGNLAVAGPSTTTLSGANTYTGSTTIGPGSTLAVGAGGGLSPGSPVELAGAGATLNASGATTPQSIAGLSGTTGSAVNLGATPLTVNPTGTGVFAGTLSGTGPLTLSGPGTQVLSGTSTLSGPTTVNAGTLEVDGSLAKSPVTVGHGATVAGNGVIGGLVVSGGGTASVPQVGQRLTVAGNAAFQPGSTLQVAVTSQQGSGLNVTGSATLGGGTVEVLASRAQYQPNQTYTILSAGAGVQGQFSGVRSTYAFLTPTLQYDASRVLLALTPNGTSFSSVATTPNGQAVAGALGTLGAGNPLFNVVLTSDAPTARTAFAQLGGDLYPSTRTALLLDSRFVRDAVLDRADRGGFSGVAGDAGEACGGCEAPVSADDGTASLDARLASQNGCTPTASPTRAVWGRLYGSHGRLSGDDASSVSRNLYGFVVGADAPVSDHWRVGIAGGASRSLLGTDSNQSATATGGTLALYASGQYDALGVRGGVAQAWYRVDSERNPSFGGFSDHDTAGYNASATQVFGEVGYSMTLRNLAFEPYVGLAYVNVSTGGFTESGGAAALKGDSGSTGVGYSTLGVRASTDVATMANGKVSVFGKIGWQHAFGGTVPTSTLSFASGGASFGAGGVPVARDSMLLGLGVDARVAKNLTLGLSYGGQFGSHVSDNALYADLLWRF
ncbi:autotransporter outer membrane beta-barrel domain-containing protein [Burkholderia guangdongensis]|uniref:autotransporter outer membrane beta-barrel domain-containing protein n=1 Tax=Burkholderia guangdongensis TaxID=1792500 RepID=UPI001FEC6137|nr:autotransporter domain-containing protein [Burkholderia guangdongensis]